MSLYEGASVLSDRRLSQAPVAGVRDSLIWVDLLRVVATFGVILVHVSHPFLVAFAPESLEGWWVANIYNSMLRSCVPIFFMVSGYLLLQKDESIGKFFSKRFNKVLVPFVFWSLFYLWWKVYVDHWSDDFFIEFKQLLNTPAFYHLWFLYSLVGLYLIVPILRKVALNSNKTTMLYILLGWLVAEGVMPLVYEETDFSWDIKLEFLGQFGGYMVLGYWLGGVSLSKVNVVLAGIAFILASAATAWGTYVFSQDAGYMNEFFYENLSLTVIVMAVAEFVLIKHWAERKDLSRWAGNISLLGGLCFGVYLVHPLMIVVLNQGRLGFTVDAAQFPPGYGLPMVTVLVFFLSALFTWTLRKIPYVKKIVP